MTKPMWGPDGGSAVLAGRESRRLLVASAFDTERTFDVKPLLDLSPSRLPVQRDRPDQDKRSVMTSGRIGGGLIILGSATLAYTLASGPYLIAPAALLG